MKKILLRLIIILSLTLQPCLAEEVSAVHQQDLDLDASFSAAPKSSTTADSSPTEVPVNDENFFQQDDSESIQLEGYAEYVQDEESAIHLEEDLYRNSLNLKAPKRVSSKSLLNASLKQKALKDPTELYKASKFSTAEYIISPMSTSLNANAGNWSIGTTYSTSLDSGRLKYSTRIFTRYDGKRFAITTGLAKSSKSSYDSYNDTIFFAPEIKLTKRLSLVDVMESNVDQLKQSNEIVLRYSPNLKKYADNVQFELGAGQSFFDSQYINSSVRFSTRFRL